MRAGRSLSTARVTMVQEGAARLEALVTAGRRDRDADPGGRRSGGPDGLASVEDCVPGRPELPGGMRANLLEHIDLRLDPACLGWLAGQPGGRLDMRGWVRFSDGRAADPLALLQVVDAQPPTSFDLGLASSASTVELSVYLRGVPAPGGWPASSAASSGGTAGSTRRPRSGTRPAAWSPSPGSSPVPDPPPRPATPGHRRDQPGPPRGPATAVLRDQLVAVYRAAMAAPPFRETEVEIGWFADELAGELEEPGFRCWVVSEDDRVVGFAYGFATPKVPPEGWYAILREAVGQDGAGHWLEGQFAVVWIAVHPDRRGRGLGRELLERLLAGAGTERVVLGAGFPAPVRRIPSPRQG